MRLVPPTVPAAVLLAALVPGALAAQEAQEAPGPAEGLAPHAAAPTVQAVRTSDAIRVDGRLDEAAWAGAAPAAGFTQVMPEEGKPASERTEIRILYDGDALYVGARMYDREAPTTRLGRRDASLPTDWLNVVFDSYHDHSTAFSFDVNPSGVRRDRSLGLGEDASWDPVWEVATTVDAEGWTAEMRIPFSQLRFNPAVEQTWGMQVERTLARRGELSALSFTPGTHAGGVQRFAHLHGLRELRTGRRLEVLPYVVARAENMDRRGNPFREDRSAGASGGLDLKYRITSDLTLDATVNPDFGQVEVDPAEVNLTAIETFFEERRPFFVEASEIFAFGMGGGNNVFYSRRIGRAPQVGAPGPADVSDAARILSAAKLSGRTGGGWSMGFLGAATERVEARFLVDGQIETATAEPFSTYLVGRVRRDARAGQTVVGGMFTAVDRRLDTDAVRSRLHAGAYTGGLDFRHQWGERAWTISGFASGSYVRGSREALLRTQQAPWRYFQRPDAPHLALDSAATSLAGLSGQVALDYRYGRHWRFSTLLGTTSAGYEVNDVGYQSRGDRIDHTVGVTYVETRPSGPLRQWNVLGRVHNEMNFAGNHIANSVFLGIFTEANDFWTYRLNFGLSVPTMDDRLTRGGPLARRPANWRVYGEIGTDRRMPVAAYATAYLQEIQGGGHVRQGSFDVQANPAPNVQFLVGTQVSGVHQRAQYLGVLDDPAAESTFGRRYLFAELRQTSVALNTRVDVTFTPGLSLQVFAQPFIASGDFEDPEALAAARTHDFVPADVEVGDIDFNVRSLRGSAVLRWEWRPGSTMYVAWQQRRSGFEPLGDFRFGRDSRALFSAQPDDVLVIKFNYWLNP